MLREVALTTLYWTPRGCVLALLYTVLSLSTLVTWSNLRSQFFPGADRGVLWGSPQICIIALCIIALSLTAVDLQASVSHRLGLPMNTLPADAPGGDLTPHARLVYLEMRREYTRERVD